MPEILLYTWFCFSGGCPTDDSTVWRLVTGNTKSRGLYVAVLGSFPDHKTCEIARGDESSDKTTPGFSVTCVPVVGGK